MDNNIADIKTPQIEEIKQYLDELGWKYRENTTEEQPYLLAPMMLSNEESTLVSFQISGDFVIVCTNGLFRDIPKEKAADILGLNDIIKLVKIFAVPEEGSEEKINVDLGFELCYEAWNKGTFFIFMDMLSFGADKALDYFEEKDIDHKSDYIQFGDKNE